MRNHRAIALVLMLLQAVASPARAEDRSQRFVEMMSRLPPAVLDGQSPLVPEFVDHEAARWVVGRLAAAQPDAVAPGAREVLVGPFAEAPPGADWTRTVGFGPQDLLAAALLRDPPDDRMALRLAPGAAARVAPALLAHGYASGDAQGFPAFWRGEVDFAIDLAASDPDDPFAVPLPKSSRIALDGDLLMQAASWPGLQSLHATTATSPVLTALATALDLPDWKDRRLVQAVVFTDPMLFASGVALDDNLAPAAPPRGALPYWSALLLADLGDGDSDLTLIAALYSARSDAEAAAQALDAGLGAAGQASFDGKTLAEIAGPGSARVVGDGPFLAVYALETRPEVMTPDLLRNRGFHVLLTAAYRRDLALLGPALP